MRLSIAAGLVGLVTTLTGCPQTGWYCQTEAAVAEAGKTRRMCFAKAEFCKGDCVQAELAHCFDKGHGAQAGDFSAPPDRSCYATAEGCDRAHELASAATSVCRATDR